MQRKIFIGVLTNCSLGDTDSGKRSVVRGNHGLIRGQRSAGCSSLVERILIDCDTRKEIFGFKVEAVLSYQRVRVC